MVTLTRGHGLKEILNCPLMILLLLQNVGEIVLITKLLMLFRIYGKIIILWVAQIEFLSLVPDHILMLLFICGLLIIVILEGSSSQGKLQCLSQFYIVDSVISMLFTMSMNVILHKVLLILLMVMHPMLLPLIDEFIPKVTTVSRLLLLSPIFLACTKAKYFSVFKEIVLLKIRNCFKIPQI